MELQKTWINNNEIFYLTKVFSSCYLKAFFSNIRVRNLRYNLTKWDDTLDIAQGVFGSTWGCPLISPTSSQRQSSIYIYKFGVLGAYRFSSVRSIITIRFIWDTYCKHNLILILSGIQVVGNRIRVSGSGHGNKTFSGYQSFCNTDIHSPIPDRLNFKQKIPNYPFSSRQPGHLNLDPWLSVSRSLGIWLYLLDVMPDFCANIMPNKTF